MWDIAAYPVRKGGALDEVGLSNGAHLHKEVGRERQIPFRRLNRERTSTPWGYNSLSSTRLMLVNLSLSFIQSTFGFAGGE